MGTAATAFVAVIVVDENDPNLGTSFSSLFTTWSSAVVFAVFHYYFLSFFFFIK